MFCDRCGAAIQSDQSFCSRCGKELAAGAVIGFPRRSRVQEHVRLLGILWLALSAMNVLGAAVLYVLANTFFVHLPEISGQQAATAWLHPFLSFIAILMFAKGAIGFLAGWGLLQRESWARMLSIVLALLALLNIPFGTAVGIYTLWVLLPAGAHAEYEAQVRSLDAA
jgi:hypothetical protein